jgi:hypothetical protein
VAVFLIPLPLRHLTTLTAAVFVVLIILAALYRSALFVYRLLSRKTKLSNLKNKLTLNYIVSTVAALVLFGAWFQLHASVNYTQISALKNMLPKQITPLVSTYQELFSKNSIVQTWRPLVLNANKDGNTTLVKNKFVPFDINNVGSSGEASWINNENSFLAIDRNGNGTIDQGQEIIGSKNPLTPIEQLDSNKDGVINDQDIFFSKLLVWADKNEDGKSQPDELKYLGKDMGATEITKTFWNYLIKTPDNEYPLITAELTFIASLTTRWLPLVLDMNKDGKAAVTKNNTVYFDVGNTNFAKATMWVKGEDAFLGIDRNGNGKIDQGREIIGTGNDLAAIAQLDDNKDGIINHQDISFSNILVWADKNQDGISQIDELQSLTKDMGATAIVKTADGYHVQTPVNTFLLMTTDLVTDNVNTRFSGNAELKFAALAMPELRGYGKIPNLSIAMSGDAALLKLAQEMAAIPIEKVFLDFPAYWNKFDLLLFGQADVHALDMRGRGPVRGDGRKLAYLETLFTISFAQKEVNHPDPRLETSPEFSRMYNGVKSPMMARFLIQTSGTSLFKDNMTYDRLSDTIIFVGDGKYPALSLEYIQKLGEEGKNAKDKIAYWSAVILFINQVRGTLRDLNTDEMTALDSAIKASDPRLDWIKLKQNYLTFLPCTPCFTEGSSTEFTDGAKKTTTLPTSKSLFYSAPANHSDTAKSVIQERPKQKSYYEQTMELKNRDPQKEAMENALKGNISLEHSVRHGAPIFSGIVCRGTENYISMGNDVRYGQEQDTLESDLDKFSSLYNRTMVLMPDYPYQHVCKVPPDTDTKDIVDAILKSAGINRQEYDRRRNTAKSATFAGASFFGLKDKIKTYIDAGADPAKAENKQESFHETAISAVESAIFAERADIVKLLIRHVNGDLRVYTGILALKAKNPTIAKIVIPRCPKKDYGYLLREAIYAKKLDSVNYLIKSGVDLNHNSKGKEFNSMNGDSSPLLSAAMAENLPLVKRLIAAGANIKKTPNLMSDLMRYKAGKNETIVKFLLDKGAVLPPASRAPTLPILKLLVDHGADLTAQDDVYGDVLKSKLFDKHKEILQYLLKTLPQDFVWNSLKNPFSKYSSKDETVYDAAPTAAKAILDQWIIAHKYDLTQVKRSRLNIIELMNAERMKDGTAQWIPSVQSLPSEYLNDRAFILAVIDKHPDLFKAIQADFGNDRDIVMKAVSAQGSNDNLKFASDALKDDKSIILAAMKNKGIILQYASARLKNDPEIIKAALAQNGWALQYLNDAARDNQEYVQMAIANHPDALSFASPRLQKELYKGGN